ncbi:DUF2264 domain-containing protein [Cellulomonas shaoxiangyii]|uniref:DUF2264 domain-containing protein n=1 Tax=Cellulomonas shaoxiangyii TaxID=2566013 RepID=A0A4P7SJE1_9CELL|nr:DUF2264 domain-containing protein [Cellulomonas shaoxiangyii]QCB93216.1 DUF2264 domain-containing protein [Cellulomonas shaoxiangyii]TGY81418.1 DUF2264 domain-containing protein [Cellulomonas shaoxiangyii]
MSAGAAATAGPGAPAGAGWDRERWAAFADGLLLAVRPHASPDHALITLPGAPGGYGSAVDGLEGFARTFLTAGFRLAGERGADPLGLAQWYADGLAAGTDPHGAHRWVRLPEHGQSKVEAASIALVLDLTRPWIWDRLSPLVQEQVVDYLSPAVGDATYPRINWVWFRLVVQTFLRSVGGPFALDEMRDDLATHDSFVRGDGWLSDGTQRSFDHYVGWALHLYPTLWGRMAGAEDLAAPRRASDTAMLDRFLQDAVHLVGGDGSPLVQGRSLVYRFAAAAPYWVGAVAEVPSVAPGTLRRCASAVVDHFAARGVPDEDGLLSLGWHEPWPALAQSYSGPGSPYWASKGLLGLALPADHPVWTADEAPLPSAAGDDARVVRPAGWLVTGTRADGIVRVVNHGVDHARPGDRVGDSPLYARLGYSTATAPLLDAAAWTSPVDQSVVLVDAAGRRSHRAGFTTLELPAPRTVGPDGAELPGGAGVLVGGSHGPVHWLAPEPGHALAGHGYGVPGAASQAGTVTVVSVVRGAWEVRLVRVADPAPDALELQVGGWPLADARPPAEEALRASGTARGTGAPGQVAVAVRTARLVSTVAAPGSAARGEVVRSHDASPLGAHAAVPVVALPVRPPADGALPGWCVVAVGLEGADLGARDRPAEALRAAPDGATRVVVTWADGARTTVRLPADGVDAGD